VARVSPDREYAVGGHSTFPTVILSVVVDNPRSWFLPFAERLVERLAAFGSTKLFHSGQAIPPGNEIAFLLSCESKVPAEILARSKHNIVVHASDLPKGKGMSPLTWQVLEGRDVIPVTLFEAVEQFDAGPIYLKGSFRLQGNELLDEMQAGLGAKILDLCEEFLRRYPGIISEGKPQEGTSTFYRRRTPKESRLDPTRSIEDQFNLLRVVDNDRYPAFFD